MKKFFKKIAFVSAMAMVVSNMPAQSAAAAEGPQMYSTLKFYLGGDATETYSDEARYAKVWSKDGYTVEFESEDESIATVSKKGKVTPVKVGTTNVVATFTDEDGEEVVKKCKVTVKQNAVEAGISDNSAEQLLNLTVGDKFTVKTYRTTADGVNSWKGKDVITDSARFTSDNKDVFTVTKKGGTVKAVAAGEATLSVWAVQSEGPERDENGKVVEYKATTPVKEYKVVVKSAGIEAVATGVKEITVTGTFAKDATFTVKKGKTTINVTSTTIAEDGKSAVLALTNKLTKGTYTVTSGDSVAEIVAEDEKVASIVVLDDGAIVTVDSNRKNAYVHYDVLNQYGESVRKNYSVSWTTSTGASVKDDKTKGCLTIPAFTTNDPTKTFTYGTTIIVTGVHTSTGNVATVNATVTAGLENRVSSVEILGVIKENNPTLIDLPVGFTDGDYLLVYKAFDQTGYEMEYDNTGDSTIAANLTFTSLSPLLVGSSFAIVQNGVVIDGEVYGAVRLTRGIQANKGGVAQIQVTSTQTGVTKVHELPLVEEQILATFTLMVPDTIIAEGDGTIEIPYEAYDQNGNAVTDFRVLHKAVSMSDSAMYIVKNDDGSASVKYAVPGNANASKNVDVPRVYTSTVINTGNVSTITLNIKDMAVPSSIKGLGSWIATKLVEKNSTTVLDVINDNNKHNSLVYYDQYDRPMDNTVAYARFSGLAAAVKVTTDAFDIYVDDSLVNDAYLTNVANAAKVVDGYAIFNSLVITAKANATTTQLAQTFEFVLIDTNTTDGTPIVEALSGSAKKEVFTAVDVTQCRSFSINGDGKIRHTEAKSYSVKGKLADGTEVNIPASYLSIAVEPAEAPKVATGAGLTVTPNYVSDGPTDALVNATADDFVDKSGAQVNGHYLHKTNDFDVIMQIRANDGTLRDTITKNVVVDDVATKIVKLNKHSWLTGDSFGIKADDGKISYYELVEAVVDSYTDNYEDSTSVAWNSTHNIKVTISKIEESQNGLYFGSLVNLDDQGAFTLKANSIAYTVNASWNPQEDPDVVMIEKAEIGDTFEVTYELGDAKLTMKCTVGADETAKFTNASQTVIWR